MRFGILAAMALVAAACAHTPGVPQAPELFVVVPAPDAHVGSVVVRHGEEARVIDSAYGAQRIDASGAMRAARVDQASTQAQFAATLAALPAAAAKFTLYFHEGSDELTPESLAELDRVLAELARRPLPDIAVIGHTDTVGSAAYNDRLSLARAERMRELLVERGLKPERISAAGRGKRELLVPTADNVSEARNRRVEIDVR